MPLCAVWVMNNEFNYRWEGAVQIRTCPYLNNVVEQDHRRVKSRVSPMLGFKSFFNARRVLVGVELVHKIIKGQFGFPRASARNPSMYGITCSLRDGCTYLQQIPLRSLASENSKRQWSKSQHLELLLQQYSWRRSRNSRTFAV